MHTFEQILDCWQSVFLWKYSVGVMRLDVLAKGEWDEKWHEREENRQQPLLMFSGIFTLAKNNLTNQLTN